ncbi:MAG: radical SAM protein [Deltaproteobacteria bacterium]|nr:MAG: radical SAM protein [Deltaproteobacteria bacterium]
MRYEGRIFRPPSEADAFILQATVGCSWNHCTYCDMYRDKRFRVRPVDEVVADVWAARRVLGPQVEKVFVADGDALVMDTDAWSAILAACREAFPRLRRVSAYATARNLLDKSSEDLARLRAQGLSRLYIGPESGDDLTLRRIAKGASFDDHVEAARRAHGADMELSAIFLLGVAGRERSQEHAEASARLATAMDPAFLALLTVTVIPNTPLARLETKGGYERPTVREMLAELRTFVALAEPTDALFRTNHASNYLPIGGRLPRDRERILEVVDAALAGRVALRPEWARGL